MLDDLPTWIWTVFIFSVGVQRNADVPKFYAGDAVFVPHAPKNDERGCEAYRIDLYNDSLLQDSDW
jgi:hypothetical protein